MKKKIALSFLVMALMMALVGGATFAWFNSTDSVTGNSFATGIVDVNKGGTLPITVSNIAPGWTNTQYLVVQNDGTLDAFFKVSGVGTPNVLSDNITVKVTLNPSEAGEKTHLLLYGPATGLEIGTFTLTELVQNTLTNTAPGTEAIKPGFGAVYKLEFSLPTSVDNTCAGQFFSGALQIDGTQADYQTAGAIQF